MSNGKYDRCIYVHSAPIVTPKKSSTNIRELRT